MYLSPHQYLQNCHSIIIRIRKMRTREHEIAGSVLQAAQGGSWHDAEDAWHAMGLPTHLGASTGLRVDVTSGSDLSGVFPPYTLHADLLHICHSGLSHGNNRLSLAGAADRGKYCFPGPGLEHFLPSSPPLPSLLPHTLLPDGPPRTQISLSSWQDRQHEVSQMLRAPAPPLCSMAIFSCPAPGL